jgi:hypothetical protein
MITRRGSATAPFAGGKPLNVLIKFDHHPARRVTVCSELGFREQPETLLQSRR